MKGKIIILSMCLFVVTLMALGLTYLESNTVTYTMHASWAKGYSSFQSLAIDSDIVVIGEVVSSISYRSGRTLVFTNHTFAVTEIYIGKLNSTLINVRQTGGIIENQVMEVDDDPLLSTNTKMLLFLKKFGPNDYYSTGGPQGKFNVVDGKVYPVNAFTMLARQQESSTSLVDLISQITQKYP